MANLRLSPGVAAKRVTRRPASKRRRSRHWLLAFKVAWLLERFRRRGRTRSSPSARQIALFVVLAGIAVAVVRAASRKASSHAHSAPASDASGAQAASQDQNPEAPTPPQNAGNDTLAGERRLTDAVQREMFERAEAPAQTDGSE